MALCKIVTRSRCLPLLSVLRTSFRVAHPARQAMAMSPLSGQIRLLCSSVPDEPSRRPDLFSFLANEIEMECAAWQDREHGKPAPSVPGFDYSLNGAAVTLYKQTSDPVKEKITIKFNVSGSVVDPEEETEESISTQDAGTDFCARPEFTVDIERGDRTLSFLCSFISPGELSQANEDEYELEATKSGRDRSVPKAVDCSEQPREDFQINEFAIYDSTLSEAEQNKVYAADCSVIDTELYDHLLEFLEQRGIDDKFAVEIVRLATLHEHNCYIKLLRNVKDFVADNSC